MTIRTALIAGTLLAVPAAAFGLGTGSTAKPGSQSAMPKSPVPKFNKADTNHDGQIEWKEAKAAGVPKKLFKRDDFNHNGKLNKTEWMFVRLDMTDYKSQSGGKSHTDKPGG